MSLTLTLSRSWRDNFGTDPRQEKATSEISPLPLKRCHSRGYLGRYSNYATQGAPYTVEKPQNLRQNDSGRPRASNSSETPQSSKRPKQLETNETLETLADDGEEGKGSPGHQAVLHYTRRSALAPQGTPCPSQHCVSSISGVGCNATPSPCRKQSTMPVRRNCSGATLHHVAYTRH